MFEYGAAEVNYLKSKDKALGAVIDRLGHIERHTDSDLFAAVVHQIAGQQISSKALVTVWQRIVNLLGTVTAENVLSVAPETLQGCGLSFRKVSYIRDFAQKVHSGEFDLARIEHLPDAEVITALSSLKGIGVWTAEMLLLFCLQRPDVFSYDDLAIQRGLRMLHRHRNITKELFESYRRRYSPYGSTASLYLWEIAGGAIPELTDPAASGKKPARMDRIARIDKSRKTSVGAGVKSVRATRMQDLYLNTEPGDALPQETFVTEYESPLGTILLAADHAGITGCWFAGQKHFAPHLDLDKAKRRDDLPVFVQARQWLDAYFAGKNTEAAGCAPVPIHLCGTAFQVKVWSLLQQIAYGQTVTYGELAARLAADTGIRRMSAQAVGGAVGRNPVSILVPCHRVVGSNGSLTGYAGGLERKQALLRLEGLDLSNFH